MQEQITLAMSLLLQVAQLNFSFLAFSKVVATLWD